MLGRPSSPWPRAGAVATAFMFVAGLAAVPAAAHSRDEPQFYVGHQSHTREARKQAAQLRSSGDHTSANALRRLAATPQAEWLVSGTPEQVRQQVHRTTKRAAGKGRIPVLVAYNVPWRDCSEHHPDGSAAVAEYKAWIDGVAKGIRHRQAVVILEPDSLGLIPWYTNAQGDPDPCQPGGADTSTAAEDRFDMLNYAVRTLKSLPHTRVYLDGTHSGWLSVGEAADRLVRAGVQEADGFALNVSNYQLTDRQLKYGTWISKCIHYGTTIDPGNFTGCASQYHPADPEDFSTWDRTDEWYAEHVDNAANAAWQPRDLAHFVIDTSRNGQGPWTPDEHYPDPQTWCNPPGRGLGPIPTTETGNDLADALLWIKIPGESDGQCDRGLGSGTVDPAWGLVHPPAGQWFPEQALDLIKNANPTFAR